MFGLPGTFPAIQARPGTAGEAATLDEARAWAERLGYPVVLKQSFSCSGVGVKVCHDLAGLQNAFAALAPHPQSAVKRLIRRASGRSWFPEQPPLWVQAMQLAPFVRFTLPTPSPQRPERPNWRPLA